MKTYWDLTLKQQVNADPGVAATRFTSSDATIAATAAAHAARAAAHAALDAALDAYTLAHAEQQTARPFDKGSLK